MAMVLTPLVRPLTSTGASRCVFELSPIWPNPFQPQHLAPPPVVTAHVCDAPASIVPTPLVNPATSTGVRRWLLEVPSPTWPVLFCPQHFTPPAFVRAHVCVSPAAMAFTPLVNPETLTGVSRCVCVLSPS